MRIGVDFDNTIAGYDKVFLGLARDAGLIAGPLPGGKRALRDRVRRLVGGEVKWQELQAKAYGPGMGEAELMPGFRRFLNRCRDLGEPVFIVSHKSLYANHDSDGVDLRRAALAWMEAKDLFADDGSRLEARQVFFEDTRHDKLDRITGLRLSHFIDDLEEVFDEPLFPKDVAAILYAPHGDTAAPARSGAGRYRRFASWDQITEHLLDRHDRAPGRPRA